MAWLVEVETLHQEERVVLQVPARITAHQGQGLQILHQLEEAAVAGQTVEVVELVGHVRSQLL